MKDEQDDRLDEEALLVGEIRCMNLASLVFSNLRRINPKYLKSLIDKMEKKGLPTVQLFKLIMFYADNLSEHMKSDTRLSEAIEEAEDRLRIQEALGM